jgi:hypothetical protein
MKSKWILMSALVAGLAATMPVVAQSTPAKSADQSKSGAKAAPAATTAPTDQEIADAKSKGMVWVNTSTKVYHKDGVYYGKTKKGKFMTEADATKAGYRAAQEPGSKAAKPAAKK